MYAICCLLFGELILTDAAERAEPIFGNIFPSGAGSNAIFGIAEFGVVNITAKITNVLHNNLLLFY